jgi:hypothetical protein
LPASSPADLAYLAPATAATAITMHACIFVVIKFSSVRLARSGHPIHPVYLLPTGPNLTKDDHTLNPNPYPELRIAEQYDERDDVPMGLHMWPCRQAHNSCSHLLCCSSQKSTSKAGDPGTGQTHVMPIMLVTLRSMPPGATSKGLHCGIFGRSRPSEADGTVKTGDEPLL